MTESSNAGVLRGASTFTLIVHGVGDHSGDDILQSIESVYNEYLSSTDGASARCERVSIAGLLPKNPLNIQIRALRLRLDGLSHIVALFDWCDARPRAARHKFKLTSLGILVWNTVRLIWLVRRGWWTLLAALVAAALPLSVILYIVIAIAANPIFVSRLAEPILKQAGTAWIPACCAYNRHFTEISIILIFGLFLVASYYILGRTLPFSQDLRFPQVFDFIGDVAAYVAEDARRAHLQQRLRETISNAYQLLPRRSIVLVGHSLGSVLLAHSLPDEALEDPPLVVTCGSPLGLMSHAFPKAVSHPADLLGGYRSRRSIRLWLNLYRDADLIGRSLASDPMDGFLERSIGDGGHEDYYADGRFWREILRMSRELAGGNFPVAEPISRPLSSQEATELSDLQETVRGGRFIAPLSMILIGVVLGIYVLPPGAPSLLCLWLPVVTALLGIGATACAAQGALTVALWRARRDPDVFRRLQQHRLWRTGLRYANMGATLPPALAFLVCFLSG